LRVSRVADVNGDHFHFNIEDTGIGIPEHFLDRLFDPFSQADPSVQHKYGGTGLGLALTKRFCDLLGGSITVHSVPNRGTQFEIKIPTVIPALPSFDETVLRKTG
jgi:signal transduction histidine kinase